MNGIFAHRLGVSVTSEEKLQETLAKFGVGLWWQNFSMSMSIAGWIAGNESFSLSIAGSIYIYIYLWFYKLYSVCQIVQLVSRLVARGIQWLGRLVALVALVPAASGPFRSWSQSLRVSGRPWPTAADLFGVSPRLMERKARCSTWASSISCRSTKSFSDLTWIWRFFQSFS